MSGGTESTTSGRTSYFETSWRPKRRVILIRQRRALQHKGPLQLDLFEVIDREFEYKAIVTNKGTSAANVLAFLSGRGCQEAILGEAKEYASLGYIPRRRRVANQLYSLQCSPTTSGTNSSSAPRRPVEAKLPAVHPSSS